MSGVERFWALFCPEVLGIRSSVAPKDKESNALQNLARFTSLSQILARVGATSSSSATLLAKIGVDVVLEFLKIEYVTFHNDRGWHRVSRPELDEDDAWWNRSGFEVCSPLDDIGRRQ